MGFMGLPFSNSGNQTSCYILTTLQVPFEGFPNPEDGHEPIWWQEEEEGDGIYDWHE